MEVNDTIHHSIHSIPHSLDMSPLVSMYVAWPHMFADTQFHMICRATWTKYKKDVNRAQHAEYKLSLWSQDEYIWFESDLFRWDRAHLSLHGPTDEKSAGCDVFFSSMHNDLVYLVDIRFNQEYTISYYLAKWDKLNDIKITICINADVYTQTLTDVLDHMDGEYVLTVLDANGLHNFVFSSGPGREDRWTYFIFECNGNLQRVTSVCDHNLREFIDFMKTSRLNLMDYTLKYTLCD
jgi:hypothetical protein